MNPRSVRSGALASAALALFYVIVVAGITWPAEEWSGDGPGGHHREGDLRFASSGTATGTARLALQDFPDPVEVTWEIKG